MELKLPKVQVTFFLRQNNHLFALLRSPLMWAFRAKYSFHELDKCRWICDSAMLASLNFDINVISRPEIVNMDDSCFLPERDNYNLPEWHFADNCLIPSIWKLNFCCGVGWDS